MLRWIAVVAMLAGTASAGEPCAKQIETHGYLKSKEPPKGSPTFDEWSRNFARADRELEACYKEHGRPLTAEEKAKAMADSGELTPEQIQAGLERARKSPDYPKMRRLALSANVCVEVDKRGGILDELKEEQKYARQTGVAYLRQRADIRQRLEEADEAIKGARDRMRDEKMKPIPCSNKEVEVLTDCLGDWTDEPKHCAALDMRKAIQLLKAIIAE